VNLLTISCCWPSECCPLANIGSTNLHDADAHSIRHNLCNVGFVMHKGSNVIHNAIVALVMAMLLIKLDLEVHVVVTFCHWLLFYCAAVLLLQFPASLLTHKLPSSWSTGVCHLIWHSAFLPPIILMLVSDRGCSNSRIISMWFLQSLGWKLLKLCLYGKKLSPSACTVWECLL